MSADRLRSMLAGALLVVSFTGCGGSDAPIVATTPSGPPATSDTLAGEWAGYVVTDKQTNACYGVTWSPRVGDPGVTGNMEFAPINYRPPNMGHGSMKASVSGGTLALTLEVPMFGPGCSMTGSGSAQANATALSGTVTVDFTAACPGTLWDAKTTTLTHQSGTMNLTKGGTLPTFCP